MSGMKRLLCIVTVVALATGGLAAEKSEESSRSQRQSWYYPQQWPFNYPNQDDTYVRALPKRPVLSYGYPNGFNSEEDAESRLGFGLLNGNSLGGANRPLASLINLANLASVANLNNLPVIRNPNFPNLVTSSFDSCTATTKEMGICTPGFACSAYGGRPSGTCNFGTVCCINVVNTCGGQVTLNNTYWETPSTAITRASQCDLTVKLDKRLIEQKQAICQIRLDFVAFNIGGPADDSVCSKDSFKVAGASNSVPKICGENPDTHMYLTVPNSGTSPSSVVLSFNFAAGETVTPSWKIKVALLPCGANYLAPDNCLQYFTSTTGTVKSFNWKDEEAARQLGNQDYNICFRNELLAGTKLTTLCLTACEGTNSFTVSEDAADDESTAKVAGDCATDYLLFAEGADSTDKNKNADRFCGIALNPDKTKKVSTVVCSKRRNFQLSYVTDNTEDADEKNVGFCLNFEQQ